MVRTLIVIFSLAGLSLQYLEAQSAIDPSPDRGIMPGTFQVASNDDDISINSGAVMYRVPLYHFPGGPGSVPMDIGLVYNSSIWETDTTPAQAPAPQYVQYYQSTTGGGWNYSFNYQLTVEQAADLNHCVGGCLFYRLNIIFPDGSRHLLRQAGTGSAFNGFSEFAPGSATTSYFTDDGTYARVEIPASSTTNPAWTLFLPNGTTASYNPSACGSSFSWGLGNNSLMLQANRIADRNGNYLTICAAQVFVSNLSSPGNSFFEPQFTVTDQVGRTATLTVALTSSGSTTQDVLTALGANNQQLTWRVNWNTYTSGYSYTVPEVGLFVLPTVAMVQSIQLPIVNNDNLQYQFCYVACYSPDTTSTLQLQSVTAPYGATVSYEYSGTSSIYQAAPYTDTYHRNASVTQKNIAWTDPLAAPRTQQWTFVGTANPLSKAGNNGVIVTSPDNGPTEYDFCPMSASGINNEFCMVTYPNGDITQDIWQLNCAWGDGEAQNSADRGNPYLAAELHTVQKSTGALTSARSYVYDRNGNVLTRSEWDWTSGTLSNPPTSAAARTTNNAYFFSTLAPSNGANGACYTGTAVPNDTYAYWNLGVGPVLNAKVASLATDGTNTQLTQLNYEAYTAAPNNAPNTTANVTHELHWRSRDKNGNPLGLPTGNPVTYPPTLTAANAAITGHTYGPGGALTSTTDPNGNTTSYTVNQCSFSGGFAYAGTITLPTNWPLTQTPDCNTGLIVSSTNVNSVTTTKSYDNIGRVTQIAIAATRETNITYTDPSCSGTPCIVTSETPATIKTARDLNTTGDGSVFQIQTLDQRGQVYLTQNNDIYVETLPRLASGNFTYEAVSNPFRSTNGTLAGSTDATLGWTRTIYDQMGRVNEVDHFDGATPPAPWVSTNNTPASFSSMSYNGNTTTITDEATPGHVKTQTVDGLGRLQSVTEDPSGLNYLTNYNYDVGDNLTTVCQGAAIVSGVCQGSQPRTFVYDSMSRLYQAKNPENGTITYAYDANGNLLTKTDARSVISTMTPDCLNRVLAKSYSGGSTATPGVAYSYDGTTTSACSGGSAPVASRGLPTSVSNGASTTNFLTYDQFQEVTSSQQITGQTFTFPTYAYNLLGEITSVTYPSGRQVSTVYDNAGRATCVTAGSTSNCSQTTAYASSVTYTANSEINSLPLGNTLTEATTFNMRFQPTGITVGSPLSLTFVYGTGTNGTIGDNGNLQSQTITVPGLTNNQSYTYDGVNRLATFTEAATVLQGYTYDTAGVGYGNRWISSGTFLPYSTQTPQSNSFTNNQWSPGTNVYDNAGNQTSVFLGSGGTRGFTYDAENRQIDASIPGMSAISYAYDGDGRRVQKTVGTTVTTYVYDAAGILAAEYGGPVDPIGGTSYLTADHLGSTRLVTNSSGAPVARYDYAPFGEELTAGIDGRTTAQGFSTNQYPTVTPDGTDQKFTSKERDAETGLDFFGARYLSSAQGRFTSPDPSNLSVDFWVPQSWNRYSYALNNPLAYVDRNGLWPTWIHNQIINEAFPGLSGQQLETLRTASHDTDYNNRILGSSPQDPAVSFVHSMSNGTDPDEAHALGLSMQLSDQFIQSNEASARVAQANWIASGHTGVSPNALTAFGNALHTVTDATSPAHAGFQSWSGAWLPAIAHVAREFRFSLTGSERANAIQAARAAYLNTFGLEMYYQATGERPLKPKVTSKIKFGDPVDNPDQQDQ
jgi:RHS repeat-associated protein